MKTVKRRASENITDEKLEIDNFGNKPKYSIDIQNKSDDCYTTNNNNNMSSKKPREIIIHIFLF